MHLNKVCYNLVMKNAMTVTEYVCIYEREGKRTLEQTFDTRALAESAAQRAIDGAVRNLVSVRIEERQEAIVAPKSITYLYGGKGARRI